MINYVKFLRGTPEAFNRLEVKDKDSLYFISEKDADSGILYLGDKVIAGTGASSSLSLTDLLDIIINQENLMEGAILTYDFENKVWVNKP